MRLIDADALIAKFNDDLENLQEFAFQLATIGAINTVKHQPTVDAVPVRHGKWIIRDNPGTGWYRITCSECGEDVTSTAPCIGFFPDAKVTWNYCPDCGARMDEE